MRVVHHILDGRLKLRHLDLVTAIAEHGSIMRAAEALYITQPAVTRGLHEVEQILGVPLFDRLHRGVAPTVYGESFVDHARAVLATLRSAEDEILRLRNADLGSVKVGTHLAGSNLLLPRAIAKLKQEHPGLTVIVKEATPDTLQEDLLAGEIDLTVGRLAAEAPNRLTQEQLYLDPIRLVARVGHPVHRRRKQALADLAEYPWVLPVEQTALRREVETLFSQNGVALPANRIECTSMPTLRHLVVTTDFIAALPMLIAVQDDQLAIIDTPLPSIRTSVGVTRSSDRPLSPAAAALLDHLRIEAQGLGDLLESLRTSSAGRTRRPLDVRRG